MIVLIPVMGFGHHRKFELPFLGYAKLMMTPVRYSRDGGVRVWSEHPHSKGRDGKGNRTTPLQNLITHSGFITAMQAAEYWAIKGLTHVPLLSRSLETIVRTSIMQSISQRIGVQFSLSLLKSAYFYSTGMAVVRSMKGLGFLPQIVKDEKEGITDIELITKSAIATAIPFTVYCALSYVGAFAAVASASYTLGALLLASYVFDIFMYALYYVYGSIFGTKERSEA